MDCPGCNALMTKSDSSFQAAGQTAKASYRCGVCYLVCYEFLTGKGTSMFIDPRGRAGGEKIQDYVERLLGEQTTS